MAITETQIAIQVAKRLKLPSSANLSLQTLIPNALQMVARRAANDYQKRKLLVSDRDAVAVTLSGTTTPYYADLTNSVNNYGIMFDFLTYGDVFHTPALKTFLYTAVNILSNRISVPNHGYYTGLKVRLTTTDTLPVPLELATDYFIIALSANTIQIAATSDDAYNGVPITLHDEGAGTNTVTPQDSRLVQWIDAPDFAAMASAIPLVYVYGWLLRNYLYVSDNAINGTLSFAVPFIPTLDTLPVQLESDVIDACVELAMNGGEPKGEDIK